MVVITYQRNKCIGCRACVEISPEDWVISKKDGKAILLGSKEKKGFFTLKSLNINQSLNKKAQKECPANIIKVNTV